MNRKKRYIFTLIIIPLIAIVILILLPANKSVQHSWSYDLLKNLKNAEIENVILSNFPAGAASHIFGPKNNPIELKNGSELILKEKFQDFGIDLKLNITPDSRLLLSIDLRFVDEGNKYTAFIKVENEISINFSEYMEGKERNIKDLSIPISADNRLSEIRIILAGKRVAVINGFNNLVWRSLEELKIKKGKIRLNILEENPFGIIDEILLGKINNDFIEKFNIAFDYNPSFRVNKKEGKSGFSYELAAGNLRLAKITSTALNCNFGSKIKYIVDIPEDAYLELGYNRYLPVKTEMKNTGYLTVKTLHEKNAETIPLEIDDEKGGHRKKVDLTKYAGKTCSITLQAPSPENLKTLLADDPVWFWHFPMVRQKKRSDDINVIILMLDTLRPDHLGCYGYELPTSPHIDRFAADHTLFSNAVSTSSWTLPAHKSLMTALFPLETDYRMPFGRNQVYMSLSNTRKTTLAERLREYGYATWAFTEGGYVSSAYGFDRGFDTYEEVNVNKVGQDAKRLITRAKKWITANQEKKFFLFLHTYENHAPYTRRHFDEGNSVVERVISWYDSGVWYADRAVGNFIQFLKSEQLLKNTLLIIVSDHGENFGRREDVEFKEKKDCGWHGRTLYDSVIKIPLIFGGLDITGTGRSVKEQVSIVDIQPTILDILNIPLPKNSRGVSLKPLLMGEQMQSRWAYAENIRMENPDYINIVALRSNTAKLIANTPPGFKRGEGTVYEFYNLLSDPQELKNIYDSTSDRCISFAERLKEFERLTSEAQRTMIYRKNIVLEDKQLYETLKALGYLGN